MANNKLFILKRVLKEIEKRKGIITPQEVLENARPSNSPIHDLFDWNDESAGEKYRLWQARQYIKDVSVEIIGRETNAFFNAQVMIEDVKTQGYFSIETILSNEELRKAVLQEALDNLHYWQRKYKDFSELTGLINVNELEKVEKTLQQVV